MGVYVLGQCAADLASASVAVCGTYPLTVSAAGVVSTTVCNSSGVGTLSLTTTTAAPSGAQVRSFSVPVAGPACDYNEHVTQSSELFALALVALSAVWAARAVYGYFVTYRSEA